MRQTLADVTRCIDCLSAGLRTIAEEWWAAVAAGESASLALGARWWSTLFYLLDTARHAASDLYRSSGSAVYGTRNPVERSMRDIHAIAATFEQPIGQALRADAGRVIAGKAPQVPIFSIGCAEPQGALRAGLGLGGVVDRPRTGSRVARSRAGNLSRWSHR